MRITLDYKKEIITLDSKQISWFQGYVNNFIAIMSDYSRIRSEIRKYFIVNDINYTDLIAHIFYQNDYYFPRAPGLVTILNYLEILDSIKENRELILDINDFYLGTFRKCAELVGAKKKFQVKVLKEQYAKRNSDFWHHNPFLMKNALRARLGARLVLGWLRKALGKQNKEKADVFFLSSIRFDTGIPENNLMFGSVMKELNKKGVKSKILRYEEVERIANLKRFIKKFLLQKQAYIGDYYSLLHFLRCNKDFKLLRKKWEAVKDNPEFKKIFAYKGYNYYDIIKPKLELVFSALDYLSCDIRNITKAIIGVEDYKVLVLDHEESMYGKGFMLNTRLDKRRKTLALAHELIYPGCGHTHIRNNEALDRRSLLWRPLPDVKCVWSEYSKKVLLESCNYPENIIRVTGNPKFDLLFKKRYEPTDIIKHYQLSKPKKRVLYVPSPVSLSYLDELNEVSKKLNDYEFLIKPHPEEGRISQIKEKIRGFKNKNLKYINNKDDVYPLIQVSDYILTDASTVGFEAMLVNKIAFGCYPEDAKIPLFMKASIRINSFLELPAWLKKLSNKNEADELIKKNKRVVEYFHYKNDGRAAERVADEIERLLEKSI